MDNWIKAGQIAGEARELAREKCKPGVNIYEFGKEIEAFIRSKGAIPAFPINISFNSVAAHDGPAFKDERTFEDQVVKIDVGACYEGAIGDTAVTVDLSGAHTDLLKASKDALAAVEKLVGVGVALGDIGKEIAEVIQSSGFTPVKNLSGHGLEDFTVHAPPTFPNIDTGDQNVIEDGMCFAVEPFSTNGAGLVKDYGNASIYSVVNAKPVRDMMARSVMKKLGEFKGLPFCTRWLEEEMPAGKVAYAIRALNQAGILEGHPPLKEVRDGLVSQAEHSFIVVDGKIKVTTKVD